MVWSTKSDGRLREWGGCRAVDGAGVSLLGEGDHADVLAIPGGVEFQRNLRGKGVIGFAEVTELADDSGVMEFAILVFAGADGRREIAFGDGEENVGAARDVGNRDASNIVARNFEGNGINRGIVGSGDGPLKRAGIVADQFSTAVDDHLRGVDVSDAEPMSILLLALGESRGRKAIVPAEIVPVIDVLGENDDGAAVEGALLFE